MQDCSLTRNFRAKLARFRRSQSISYLRVFRTRLHAYRVQLLFHQRIETPLNLGFASLSLVTDPEKFGGQPSRFIQLSWPVFPLLPTKFSGLNTGQGPILFGLTQSHPGSGDFFLQWSVCPNMFVCYLLPHFWLNTIGNYIYRFFWL